MAVLLVDKIEKTLYGETALTTTLDKFLHNLQIIGIKYRDELIEASKSSDEGYSDIQVIGRYITFIELSKDSKIGQMMFFDVENDEDKAFAISDFMVKFKKDERYRTMFMTVFYQLLPHYQDNYSAATLDLSPSMLN